MYVGALFKRYTVIHYGLLMFLIAAVKILETPQYIEKE